MTKVKMTTKEVQSHLKQLGWPIDVDGAFGRETLSALKDFQFGYTFDDLQLTGAGDDLDTQRALDHAVQSGGFCSEHFKFVEFADHDSHWIKINRVLVRAVEVYHGVVGAVSIASGYRSPEHNKEVGGASSSQHLYGNAFDDSHPRLTLPEVKKLKVFSGIGIIRKTGKMLHGDVRHCGPNTTGGTVNKPTIWYYD